MNRNYLLRLAVAAVVVLSCLLAISGLLLLAQSVVDVFGRLADAPTTIRYGFWAFVMALVTGFIWLAVVLVWPTGRQVVRQGPPRKQDELEAGIAVTQPREVDRNPTQVGSDRND